MFKPQVIAAITLMFSAALLSQTPQNTSFAGTWKLNVAKSKFKPGPALKSETVVIPSGQGKVEVHEVNAEGKEINWSYNSPAPNGTPAAIEGIDGATVSASQASDTVVDHTWKTPNFNGTGHGTLSKNGKVMTYTLTGTNAEGKPEHNVLIFERQ